MRTKTQENQRSTPELRLEQAALGELKPEHEARLTEADRLRAARLAEEDAEALQSFPVPIAVAGIRQKVEAHRQRSARGRRALGLALVPACAVALLTLVPSTDPAPTAGGPALTERTKGPPLLQVFRQTEGGEQRLSPGDRAASGDVLQLRYDARGEPYGVIVSLDGAGVLTPHVPERLEGPAARLERALVTLPSAYELDDAPGFEHFFIVTSPTPFDVQTVVEAIRDLDPSDPRALELPEGLSQSGLHIDKETP